MPRPLAILLGWLARHAFVYVLLVAAIVVGAQLGTSKGLSGSVDRLAGAEADLQAFAKARQGQAVTALDQGRLGSIEAIDRRLAEIDRALARPPPPADPLKLLNSPRTAIVGQVRQGMERDLLEQERTFLIALRANLQDRGRQFALDAQIASHQQRLATLDTAYAERVKRLATLQGQPVWMRYGFQGGRLLDLIAEDEAAQRANRAERTAVAARLQSLQEVRRDLKIAAELATPQVAVERLEALIAPVSHQLEDQRQALRATVGGEARYWWQRLGIGDALLPAVVALVAVILTPFAIRTVFYWVLAPLAATRPAVTFQEGEHPAPAPADRSAASKAILLAPDEELLVKQGFLQSAPRTASASTKLLLDWRHPVVSLVSGLFFVTRLRGAGDPVTVSALHDPLTEVAVLDLPADTACVIRPRSVAAVVQPMDRPLRIVSRWRLLHLNGWLAGQVRFLIFHGPARIVVKGDRGVRFEPAGAGRTVGQDQLVGFSARLAYSVTRTETFLPYLFGMTGLFKDYVASGEGVLVVEEAPLAARGGPPVKRGLEGLADAALKVFGI